MSKTKIRVIYATLMVMLMFTFAGCKSSKSATGSVDSGESVRLRGDQLLEAVIDNTPVYDSFSSRLKLTMPSGKGELNLNGYLKMQRDELIQISLLVPILRSEAVRIEISPDRVLIIDRLNKRYADASVDDLRRMYGPYADFNTLQALFSNSFFQPGKKEFKKRDFSSFKASAIDTERVLLTKQEKELKYSFVTSTSNNRLVSSEVAILANGYSMNWQYDRFINAGQTTFPSDLQIILKNPKRSNKIGVELSRISVDKETLTSSPIPAKYQPVSLSELIEKIRG
ncbi:MAG: DUF4292 domain-containing protein [Bacteroides sp.]|nr:DUF4292 domain-containing protein [Bacteroides sp.]